MFARAWLLLAALLLPFSASAVELNLSLDASGQYDTNVTREDNKGDKDFSFRLGPAMRAHDQLSSVAYRVEYRPIYEVFVKDTSLNELSHLASGELLWNLGDRTSLLLRESFSLTQQVNAGRLVPEEDLAGDPILEPPDSEVERSDIYRNNATALLRHNFTSRMTGQLNVSHAWFDSDQSDSIASQSLGGTGSLTYAVGARDRVGLGGGVSWQHYENNTYQPGSDTFTYRGFLSWIHQFGENTELNISGGPAYVTTNQDSPDPEVTVAQIPYYEVPADMTVDEVYDSLGLHTPSNVSDIDGNPLSGDMLLPMGSVLVTDTTNCSQGSLGDGTLVYSESNCGLNDIAIVGDDDTYLAALLPISDVTLMFPPGTDPGQTDDSTITFFGSVGITHQWLSNLKSSLNYTRTDSGASSLGSATIADQVTFLTGWQPMNKLDIALRGDWVKRKSINEVTNSFREIEGIFVPGRMGPTIAYTGDLVTQTSDRSVDTMYWSISGRAAYRLTRQLTVTGRVTYQNQDTKRASTTSNSTFQNVIGFIGVRYDFDPFRF